MDPILALAVAVAGLLLSVAIGHAAGQGTGTAAWGLLGPPGWIVAAVIGASRRASGPAPGASKAPPERILRKCPLCDGIVHLTTASFGWPVDCPKCGKPSTYHRT